MSNEPSGRDDPRFRQIASKRCLLGYSIHALFIGMSEGLHPRRKLSGNGDG